MSKRIAAILILALTIPTLAFAHSGSHRKVMGTISKIEARKFHVSVKDGHDTDVPFTTKTSFVRNGKTVTAKDVVVGSRVVIELTSKGVAEKVTVGKTGKAPQHH
jgi:hypothetical protein